MKKLSLILAVLILSASLASCAQNGQKKDDDTNSVDTKIVDTVDDDGNDTKPSDTKADDTEKPKPSDLTPASVEKAIADAVGAENYLCNVDIEKNWLENHYGLDMSKVEDYIAKQNSISSVNPDTVIVLKVADGYVDTAVDILNDNYAQTVSYIRQYPFGVAKVLSAKIYKEGNCVMYILAGAGYDGDDSEEEDKLAASEYAKIDASLEKLFGELPENLAVVPEDNGGSGGLIGFDDFDTDTDDGVILGG